MLSDETVTLLKSAGWTPGRKVDVRQSILAIEAEGYAVNDILFKFLEEFNNLKIEYRINKMRNRIEFMEINPSRAVRGSSPKYYKEDFPAIVKQKLCPFGEAASGHLILSSGIDGNIYASLDHLLWHVGPDPITALDNICMDRVLKAISQ